MLLLLLLFLQASAARAALEAEQALVSQLKEEASISAAASAQLLSIEQQVRRDAARQFVICCT
jgi:ADP-ribose pyrophosphatase YjhB (NUDIX family)